MSAPFSFSLKPSRLLYAIVLLAHLLPVLCAVFAGNRTFVLPLVCTLAVISALLSVRQHRRMAGMRLTVVPRGLSCIDSEGDRREVALLPESADLGWLIVLVMQEQVTGRRIRAAVTRSMMSGEAWRSLRRCLRWELPEELQLP